jgi:hypothetical protein
MKLLKIFEEVSLSLSENIQLANKYYFNSGKLSPDDKETILNITKGNNFTKIISDIYYYLKKYGGFEGTFGVKTKDISQEIKKFYNDVVNYNKNVFPIKGYDVYNLSDNNIVTALESRRKIINIINNLPSIAKRNLKNDIHQERNNRELSKYLNDIEYFMAYYSLLSNREEQYQTKILKKMFKSDTTLEELLRFIEEKENLIGGKDFTKDDIIELAEDGDMEIIYDLNNIMIVRVDSPFAIKKIGCNSLWCFTYGSGFDSAYREWNNFSYNDTVYVLIDLREKPDSESFMHVLIRPLINENGKLINFNEDNEDQQPLYNMSNDNFASPYYTLNYLFGAKYKKIIKDYLNFEY